MPLRDATVSRRHARIIVEGDQVYVQDLGSASGTFVNGIKLAANERRPLAPNDSLRFGDVEATYIGPVAAAENEPEPEVVRAAAPPIVPLESEIEEEPGNDVPTAQADPQSIESLAEQPREATPEDQPDALAPGEPAPVEGALPAPAVPPLVAAVQPVPPDVAPPPVPAATIPLPVADPLLAPAPQAPVAVSRLNVAIDGSGNQVDPGSDFSVKVTVRNAGTTVEQVALSVDGLPPEWVTLAPANANILPGTRAEATLTVRPPKGPGSAAGDRPFSVVAASPVTGASASAHSTLAILPFEASTVELSPRKSDGDFRVTVQNQGNAPLRLQFAGEDAEARLEYKFTPQHLDVPAGESRTAKIEVNSPGRPMTGVQSEVPFAIHVVPDAGARRALQGTLNVKPRFGRGIPLKRIAALFLVGLAALLGVWFLASGEDEVPAAAPETPAPTAAAEPTAEPSPEPTAVVAAVPDFLCGPDAPPAPPPPVAGAVRDAPSFLASVRAAAGADPTSPLFAQNDTRWGQVEYAKAMDEEFRFQNTCGSTIEQCGCAMTSVATVMALFQLVTMPDGSALTPEAVNAWFNIGAERTASGWVSQGYIYGNVIWSAANQLSGAIKQVNPNAATVRFKTTGSGSEDLIRSELQAGRPIVLEVPGHWIAAVGIDPATNKILINDPYYADRTTLDAYEGRVLSSVLFEASTDLSAVVVSVPSDNRVRVTDDQGRVTGTLDTGPANGTPALAQTAIPGSTYSFTSAWRDPTCTEKPPPPGAGTIQITLPAGGGYKIEVTHPPQAGTTPSDTGTSVAIHAYDDKGNVTIHTEDGPGDQVVTMTPSAPGTTPTVIAATAVPTATPSITPTRTPTRTVVPTVTTGPGTPTPTPPPTSTSTHTPTNTAVATTAVPTTAVPTSTSTHTPTPTPTATSAPTDTPTPSPTPPPTSIPGPTFVGWASPPCTLDFQTLVCNAVVQGDFTYLIWQVNGVEVTSRIWTTLVYQLPHLDPATYQVRYTACNEVEGAPPACRLSAQTTINVTAGP